MMSLAPLSTPMWRCIMGAEEVFGITDHII
jgi:hypothetical protein